jgi:hypothetical protein
MWHNELNCEITAFEKHVLDELSLTKRRLHDMAIDLTGLKAAQAKVQTDVTALIALAQTAISNQQDPTLQGQLDAITASLNTSAGTAEAELASAAAGPSGSTGTSAPTGASGPTGG